MVESVCHIMPDTEVLAAAGAGERADAEMHVDVVA